MYAFDTFNRTHSSAVKIKDQINIKRNGFKADGARYYDKICTSGDLCKFAPIFSAEVIQQDNRMSNQSAGYGMLAFGPHSNFWYGFVDPKKATQMYSIEFDSVDLKRS